MRWEADVYTPEKISKRQDTLRCMYEHPGGIIVMQCCGQRLPDGVVPGAPCAGFTAKAGMLAPERQGERPLNNV